MSVCLIRTVLSAVSVVALNVAVWLAIGLWFGLLSIMTMLPPPRLRLCKVDKVLHAVLWTVLEATFSGSSLFLRRLSVDLRQESAKRAPTHSDLGPLCPKPLCKPA